MLLHAVAIALLQAGNPQAATVARDARRAVEQDSVAAVAARWNTLLRRNPDDRAAILGLAAIAAYTYDYARAERRYLSLLGQPGERPDIAAVRARLGIAIARRIRGQYREAEAFAAQAAAEAEAIGDRAGEAEALLNLATLRGRTRGAPARDSLLAAAAPLVRGSPALEASYHCARAGGLATRSGPEAESEARLGADMALLAGERRTHAGCLFVHAQILIARGTSGDAPFRLIDDALAEFVAVRDRAAAGTVLQWAGYYQTAQGSYGVAKHNLDRAALESTAAGDRNGLAWTSSGLATLALRTGDLATASVHLTRAVELFDSIGDMPGSTNVIGMRGDLARATGDLAAAADAYRAGLDRNLRSGNAVGAISLHNGLADLALMQSRWSDAQRELDAARQLARSRNLTGWDEGLDSWFATLALLRGDLDEAERTFTRTLERRQLPWRRYVTWSRLAEIRARKNDVAGARAFMTTAMDSLDHWRAAQSDHDLRLAVFGIQESWADPDLGVATVLNVLAMNGLARIALDLAERRRARDLLDHLLQGDALRVEGPDSSIRRRSANAAWTASALTPPDERTAMLEFVTGRRQEPTTLFVLTRSGLAAHTLPAIDSLAPVVARYLASIEAGVDATSLGRALGAALLDPALRTLPATVDRLIIIPDDVLHRVPFDALLLNGGRPAVERFAMSIAPSATTFARLHARARNGSPRPPTLVLADPAFGAPQANAGGLAGAFAAAGGLPRLRYTAGEASSVARAAPGATVLTRARASEAFVRTTPLRGFRLLHFATHAVVDERALPRTGLALAPGAGHDGFLGPGDLATLELDADLVVLSACRTASGIVVRGEGVQGLTTPLLEAGARAVIATSWQVRDRPAARLVGGFYQALARGFNAGDALRAAKLEALRRNAPLRDWAAFTLIGDPLVTPLSGAAARR